MTPHRAPPPSILVVDDDPDSADLLASVLRQELACDVQTAYDGDEALHSAIARRPDVVVMDVDMPRMNGPEAALLLRNAYPGMAPLMVALTAHERLPAAAANETLFAHHFVKPVDLDALVTALDSALEREREPQAQV